MTRKIDPPLQVSIGDNRPWQTWFLRIRDAVGSSDDAIEELAREIATLPLAPVGPIQAALEELRREFVRPGDQSAELAQVRAHVAALEREISLIRSANQSHVFRLSEMLARGAYEDSPRQPYRTERWIDINMDIGSLRLGASSPTFGVIGATGLERPIFAGVGVAQSVHGCVELDHGWKVGTNIRPHVHYAPTTAAAGNIRIGLEYNWVNTVGNLNTSTTIVVVDAASGVAWQSARSNWPEISAAGLTGPNSQFTFRVFRDSADVDDTYPDGVAMLTVGLHVLVDDSGSRAVDVK